MAKDIEKMSKDSENKNRKKNKYDEEPEEEFDEEEEETPKSKKNTSKSGAGKKFEEIDDEDYDEDEDDEDYDDDDEEDEETPKPRKSTSKTKSKSKSGKKSKSGNRPELDDADYIFEDDIDAKNIVKNSKKNKKLLPGEILRERKRWGFLGLPWTFTKYILTNKKIIIQMGFFTQIENEILLFRVKDMTMQRTFFQRMFGLGTLTVYADDKTNSTLEIKNIKRVRQFKEALSDAVEKDRARVNLHPREIINNSQDYDDDDDNDDR